MLTGNIKRKNNAKMAYNPSYVDMMDEAKPLSLEWCMPVMEWKMTEGRSICIALDTGNVL
jgi:hypothetical protein